MGEPWRAKFEADGARAGPTFPSLLHLDWRRLQSVRTLNMLDADLLYHYMHRFFGYGSLTAKYWFIGLEEGGVSDIAQLEARLNVWDAAGRPILADPREFHARLGGIDWFRPGPPLQATWRPLMRVRYAAEGLSDRRE